MDLPEIGALRTRDLLRLYARILTELLRRDVIRSRNAPAGDLAEVLVAKAYGGRLAPQAEKSWDVVTDSGGKIQVKCRVVAGTGAPRGTFSPFRSWDFDTCVFVLFDAETYDVRRAVELGVEQVRAVSYDTPWVAGERMTISQLNTAADSSDDVTELIRTALEGLDSD